MLERDELRPGMLLRGVPNASDEVLVFLDLLVPVDNPTPPAAYCRLNADCELTKNDVVMLVDWTPRPELSRKPPFWSGHWDRAGRGAVEQPILEVLHKGRIWYIGCLGYDSVLMSKQVMEATPNDE